MLRRILTDMELPYVYDIPTNYRSRTLLPAYAKLPGGETTATMRLQSDSPGFKGNIQYPEVWMNYVINILNQGNKQAEKYLFRQAGGIQNSPIKGRMEQLTCEGNIVNIYQVIGRKNFVSIFHSNDVPPKTRNISDPRIQKIRVVNRLNQLTRSTPFEVYFPLMGRPGEELWIDEKYLFTAKSPAPVSPSKKLEIIVYDDFTTSAREIL